MKKPVIKLLDKVIVLLLIVLGVSSCSKDEIKPEYGVVSMYGVPSGKSVIINKDNDNYTQEIIVSENTDS